MFNLIACKGNCILFIGEKIIKPNLRRMEHTKGF